MKKADMAKLFVSVLLLCIIPAQIFAQATGTVKGRVLDSMTGDAMIGVTVMVDGTKNFGITDINGNYTIRDAPEGPQKIVFRMMGYQTSAVDTVIKPGLTERINISMSFQTAKEVVVKARRVSNTSAALLSRRKKAAVAQDAISAEEISKSPDSDAADAAKRVTGVTIVGGNTIFIRGLGERYSGVMFAGSVVPSPDPDKRVIPLDIFPTALLDNLTVIKAYTPDMPGEFGGGIVQINPKDYPEDTVLKLSIGTSCNSSTTGKDFLTYNGGKYDYFGFDDGTRDMPSGIDEDLRNSSYTDDEIENISKDFNNQYTPETKTAYLPVSLGFSYGDSYKIGEKKLGVIFSGMFKNGYNTRDTHYFRINDSGNVLKDYDIEKSTYSTSSGLLLSTALSGLYNKFRLTSFYSHQSKDSTSIYDGYNHDRQDYGDLDIRDNEKRYRLEFVEESLLFNQLEGEHYMPLFLNSTFNWTAEFSKATRNQPDTRTCQLSDTDGDGNYFAYYPTDIKRLFQNHDEYIYDFTPSISIPFKQWDGLVSKIKIGSGINYRERKSESRTFTWYGSTSAINEPLEDFLTDSVIDTDTGYYITEATAEYDNYKGRLTIISAYSQVDMPLTNKLRLVGGARYEYSDMDLITYDPTTGEKEETEKEPLEKNNILPALSLTYTATNRTNIRFAYSKTLARPDFREVSEFKYSPMISDVEVIGNPDLKQCDIQNLDFRAEYFPNENEIMAFSLFYKFMKNPIEMLEVPGSGGTETYTYENAMMANNMGAELELRKNIGFVSQYLSRFSILMNLAYIYSIVNVNDGVADYSNNQRPLQGQSPYIINTTLNYENDKSGTTIGVLFNLAGRRIVRVGTVSAGVKRGDVYEESVPRLDFIAKQNLSSFGQLKLTVSNILDPEIKQTQERINAATGSKKTYTIESYKNGINVSLGYTWSL